MMVLLSCIFYLGKKFHSVFRCRRLICVYRKTALREITVATSCERFWKFHLINYEGLAGYYLECLLRLSMRWYCESMQSRPVAWVLCLSILASVNYERAIVGRSSFQSFLYAFVNSRLMKTVSINVPVNL